MKPAAQTLHVLSATHWDREWMLSFVSYRRHLLHYTDTLLDVMERDPAFRHYHMDGQVICVEDYLALRPERREALCRLVRDGRILIGPWYTLPDMPLVHGENVVRNLLVGIRVSDSLGGAMREGYTACSNGQIAQLPQIYSGFGIRSAILYKGIGGDRTPKEFRWRGPDGSELLGIHLAARYGRSNFYCLLYHEVVAGVIHDAEPQNWLYEPGEDWMPFRVDGQRHHDPYIHEALARPEGWHEEHLRPYLAKLRAQTAEGAATSHLLGFHGMDHTAPFPATPRLIAAADRVFPDLRVIDSTIPAAIAAIRAEVDYAALPVHEGELRDSKAGPRDRDLYWPTLSARLDLKVENRRTEHLLIDAAEPLSAWAWLRGAEYPAAVLDDAWRLLLANHAHDSIDGCSLNKVADDILGRFTDAQAISEGLITDACGFLVKSAVRASPEAPGPARPYIVVFNPTPYPRGGFCEVDVDIPGSELPAGVALRAADGTELRPHVTPQPAGPFIQGLIGRPMAARRCRLQFLLPEQAGMSGTALEVVPIQAPAPAAPGLTPDARTLENEFLRLRAAPNGTVSLLHRASGRTYEGLHQLEDVGDTGDPWHFKPTGAPVVAGAAEVTLVENTPYRASLEVRYRLELPLSRSSNQPEGTAERGEVRVSSRFSLARGSRRVDVVTTIENGCRDHRLRVRFPTGLKAATAWAGGQFHIDERPVQMPDMQGWIEPVDGHPNFGCFGLSDGAAGLAILNLGLPEYFVVNGDTLTLTLLRATQLRNWPAGVGDAHSVGAQCLGPQTVRYALYPHAGSPLEGGALQEYRRFAVPLVCSQVIATRRPVESAPLLQLEPAGLEIACIKRAARGDALIVRVWNPGHEPLQASLLLGFDAAAAAFVTLNEDPDPATPPPRLAGARRVEFSLPPARIATLQLTPRVP